MFGDNKNESETVKEMDRRVLMISFSITKQVIHIKLELLKFLQKIYLDVVYTFPASHPVNMDPGHRVAVRRHLGSQAPLKLIIELTADKEILLEFRNIAIFFRVDVLECSIESLKRKICQSVRKTLT